MRSFRLHSLLYTIVFLFAANAAFSADKPAFGGVGLQVVPTIDGNLVVLNVQMRQRLTRDCSPGT